MTMIVYSGLTIIYIALIIVTIYAGLLNKKHEKLNFLNMDFDNMFAVTVFATMFYCFISARVVEHMQLIWGNFIFILCVVGAIIFAGIICSGLNESLKEKMNQASVEETLETMKNKKELINDRINELYDLLKKPGITPELNTRIENAIDELKTIRTKYDATIGELILQKTLIDAKIDNENVESIKLTSKKSVIDKMNLNIDKFDSSREIEDTLNDVRSLMENYK